MKLSTPREIAIVISLIVSVIVTISVSLIYFFSVEQFNWLVPVFAFPSTFLISYFTLIVSIERFIYKKIRLIYKTIHKLKTQPNQRTNSLDIDSNVFEEVNQEVVEWNKKRNEEIDKLKVQEAFRREFIGNLSHELKTPLFNIQGYLFTLLEGGLDDPTINLDYLKRADRNLDRLVDLVKDLDSITKLESGNQVLEKERFNVVDLASEIINALELRARERKMTLAFNKVYEKPIWVMADRRKIAQVFSNLLMNSINYGHKGGETKLRFFDMDVHILVEVADNGIGINEEELPRIFERFYRVDKSRARNAGGTGLGLAIVKHIIDAHGQSINVRSTENVGSTFSFTLEKAK